MCRWNEIYHGGPASGTGEGCSQLQRQHRIPLPGDGCIGSFQCSLHLPQLHRQPQLLTALHSEPKLSYGIKVLTLEASDCAGLWWAELMLVGPTTGMLEAFALSHALPKLCWDQSYIADIGR